MENIRAVGKVTHFFGRINVAVIAVKDTISVGDQILIKGPLTDIEQTVDSMEIDHAKVMKATVGQNIGMKLKGQVRENDMVYKRD